MGERKIIVTEDGKKIYEGPEQRHATLTAMAQSTRALGLSLDTWIKLAGFIIAATIFFTQTNDFMRAQVNINKYVLDFTKNSDSYHSAQTGRVFAQGKPTDTYFMRGRAQFSPIPMAGTEEPNRHA